MLFTILFAAYNTLQQLFRRLLYSIFPTLIPKFQPLLPRNENIVLVTGCSTGIGKELAFGLANEGFTVFAAVRKNQDSELLITEFRHLSKPKGVLKPVILDVNKEKERDSCIQTITQYINEHPDHRLAAVIHNAGIASTLPIEMTSKEQIELIYQTNVLSPIEFTNQLIPLLHPPDFYSSRIIFVGSIAGTTQLPLFGIYSSTKAALDAYTRILATEVMGKGIAVSILKPGVILTPIYEKVGKETEQQKALHDADDDLRKYYDPSEDMVRSGLAQNPTSSGMSLYLKYHSTLLTVMQNLMGMSAKGAPGVVQAILQNPFPGVRYWLGIDAALMEWFYWLMPGYLFELFLVHFGFGLRLINNSGLIKKKLTN